MVLVHALIMEKKKDYKELALKSPREVWDDVNNSLDGNYNHIKESKCLPIKEVPYFYPEMVSNPDKYIYDRAGLAKTLTSLKSRGFFLFIVTNAHYEFANLVLRCSLGEKWSDYFDLIVFHSAKPSFWEQSEKPFYDVKVDSDSLAGDPLKELASTKLCLQGNAHHLKKHIAEKSGKDGKILYFGDNYSSDCLHAQKSANIDGVAVMEEIQEKTQGKCDDYFDYEKYWGKYTTETINQTEHDSFWYDWAHETLMAVVPLIDCKEVLEFFEDSPAT
jgi:FMN phosphatase YigB (HAD superfamily)